MNGRVVYLYAFDIANEIRTADLRSVLGQKPFPFVIEVGPTVPKDVSLYRPLTIALPPEIVETNVGRVELKPTVKVLDIGVISVSYEIAFSVGSLGALIPYHQLSVAGRPLTDAAESVKARVKEDLAPYLVKPTEERLPAEAYTVFCLEKVEESQRPVSEWAAEHRAEIVTLLAEHAGDALAEDQVRETMDHALSYTVGDLTVIDWDAALVIDRSGYFDDVLYVIDIANVQLEEFRLLDDRLDRYFLSASQDLEKYYKSSWAMRGPGKVLGAFRIIRIDITKMSEEVTNITKFVGDWYLARAYLVCKDRFHLGHWESSVDQKLQQLDDVYTVVQADINNRRMLILESIIVALFLFDIVMLVLKK